MQIKKIEFYNSFTKIDKMKDTRLPEVAFIGRSNVGKSSLLNHLCNRKIAFTSSTPGKTQLINFFLINEKLYFVDLPGYGYAKVSAKMRKDWGKNIEDYLQMRTQLKAVFFLLDIRRIPNQQDKIINAWLKQLPDIETFYILTKADKLSKAKAAKQKGEIAKELFVDQGEFSYYSVTKNIGRKEILDKLDLFK